MSRCCFILSLSVLFSVGFIHCDKPKLPDEDMVSGLLYKIRNHSQLQFDKEYKIQHFSQWSTHETNQVTAILNLPDEHIKKISYQFKKLRRSATRAGYGKYPSGWEYYIEENNEQLKLIIDTFNHQVIIHHENYFGMH